jgi:hypothetical protein
MTSTKGASKKPIKPPSGYNIFYQNESKRARDRENARKIYVGRSSFVKAEHRQVANKTRFIGGKWKKMAKQSQELFLIRGKNELDMYNVHKVLWTTFDKVCTEHFSPGLADMMKNVPGSHKTEALCSSVVTMANEPHCQLIRLLF